jgi:RNA polymerase sigma-70 factor (ECF subfamily)
MEPTELIAEVLDDGRKAWGFPLAASVLSAHLQGLGVDVKTISSHGRDLYLAAACAAGVHPALMVLENEFLSRVPQFVWRVCRDPARVEEIRQDLRVRMLVGPPPRIASYAGSGPLTSFLCVAAVRIAVDREGDRTSPPLAIDADVLTDEGAHNPESEALSGQHRRTIQEALDQALLQLPPRDKAVLRFYFVEGLNIEAIGAIYQVHRSSVARWLTEIREALLDTVKERVGRALGATPSEIHSLLRDVRSGLRASVSRLWRKSDR